MDLIRKKRRALDITQSELGVMVGYTGHTATAMVCAWEKGIKGIPKDKLLAVSKALDIPVEKLLERKGKHDDTSRAF